MSKDNFDELTRKKIEEIALDFIVNEKNKSQIISEYNISEGIYYNIVQRMNLIKKRESYRKKVLSKALDRCSTYQSKIIYKATEILHSHVDKLSQKAKQSEHALLSSAEIRDVMAILQIISKENRLDNDKPTDRTIREVKVELPEGFSSIIKKPEVIVEAEFKDIQEENNEKEEEEVIVEVDDDIMGSPLD